MDPVSGLDFTKGGGLVTAIAVDDATGEVLMVAAMNEQSFRQTLATGEAVYWSRTRGLWHKGEQSGHTQRVNSVWIDCDADVVLVRVDQRGGAACHTGRRTCFFRTLEGGSWVTKFAPLFDPKQVYRK